jgi:hypothetical protein
MTEMLVLDPDEAEAVRGYSREGHAIAPVRLKDGRFMLGTEVLDDPAHEDVRDYLRKMPLVPLEKLPTLTPEDAAEAEAPVLTLRSFKEPLLSGGLKR